jgi:hypothetical protein
MIRAIERPPPGGPDGVAVGVLQREPPQLDRLRPPGQIDFGARVAGEVKRPLRRMLARLGGGPAKSPGGERDRRARERPRSDTPAGAQPLEAPRSDPARGERQVEPPVVGGQVVLHPAGRGDAGIEQGHADLVELRAAARDARLPSGQSQRRRQLGQDGPHLVRLRRGFELERLEIGERPRRL